ncbi:putative nucleotidyltransferase [Methanoculleus bourgensis MS2]|jgi:predicted nucleotidyltransferase|uniref:Nucleotidyltransferase n=2 Tax=Methanoculleus bourgensis TaxID=83986 RepID=I7LKI4_METBM|nr:putative nucleotidyltransferase [Methanoculleus bourgensis MS2]
MRCGKRYNDMRRRHLLKAEEKEEVLRTIRTVLAGFDEIEVGYVFGSFSQGDFGDVDVAILVAGEPTPYQAMRFRARVERELERGFGYRFEADVKILNTAPVSFQYEVIKSGRRVFSRDNERRVRYEAGVLSLYLDYAETLDWFDRVLLTRV